VARQGLVHSVIHNLVHKVVEPTLTGRSDIHARSLTNGLETFQDCDVPGVVAAVDSLCHGRGCSSSFRHTMCTTTDVPAGCTSGSDPSGFMPCSGADVRSDGSSVLSVPGPQDDPGNPARLTPSYYLLSGENPGSEAVSGYSSTTFLHRVIFGLLEGFQDGRRTLCRTAFPALAERRCPRAPVGHRTSVRQAVPSTTKHLRIVMRMPVEGLALSGRKVIFL
jgi:hypothetical protein